MRPSGPFPFVEVCSDWKLAAISATKFSNAVNLPLSAGRKQFWLDMEERWLHLARSPAFLEQISNFNAASRKSLRRYLA